MSDTKPVESETVGRRRRCAEAVLVALSAARARGLLEAVKIADSLAGFRGHDVAEAIRLRISESKHQDDKNLSNTQKQA